MNEDNFRAQEELLFGRQVDLPSFPDPDTFRRNVVPGNIPCPTLVTQTVQASSLVLGDVVLFIGKLWSVVAYPSNQDLDDWRAEFAIRAYGVENGFPVPVRPTSEVVKVSAITFGLLSHQIPVKWIRDDSKTYYGKFLDQLEEYCYETSFDGASETAGHCDEIGWFASLVDIHRVNGQVFPARTDPVIQQWANGPNDYPAGYIVSEDDRGAVDVVFFATVAELDAAWSELLEEESNLRGPDEEDCVINPDGSVYFAGKLLVRFVDDETTIYEFIREEMERRQFWPNVWRISDHGNAVCIDITETGEDD